MKITFIKFIILVSLWASIIPLTAQTEKKELIPFGDMNSWFVREIEESFVIGGNTRYIYEIGTGDTIFDNTPYHNTTSPWANSSVLAKVKGVTKTSISVFPEKRGDGYCARLETLLEKTKVLGLFNINVLVSGTIFLGQMVEPITNTDNPQSKLITGIPFTKKPKALQYDYKVITGGDCIKATGFGSQQKVNRKDMAEVQVLLQHRWEDAAGNIYAKRIATGWERFDSTEKEWQNGHRLPIIYGDISAKSFFAPHMGLIDGEKAYYTRNSKGKMVPIHETAWGTANDSVTHIVLQFSSSNGGAYIGSLGSRFWVDNVYLVY